jgi:hypothetical protein
VQIRDSFGTHLYLRLNNRSMMPISRESPATFEVALIPISDVDREKEFYTRLGWRLDDDVVMGSDFRVVQLTPPPGSACSISLGTGVTTAAPG